MNARHFSLLVLVAGLAATSFAADEKDPKLTAREALKARILEENAKKQAASGAVAPAPAATAAAAEKPKPDETAAKTAATSTPAATEKDAKSKDAAAAKDEPATVLPKVQVNQSRVTELDRQIYEQQKEIAHEKQNTKQGELDKALNDSKVSKALAIFGGESSQHRAGIAGERVKIMEEEKDLLEAMKTAKTKDEKAELQKQLDELRAYRRELEKSLR